jgi:hypothetical protein
VGVRLLRELPSKAGAAAGSAFFFATGFAAPATSATDET